MVIPLLAIAGVICAALIGALVFDAIGTVSVNVINDRGGPTRLSGCVDDALDLGPAAVGTVEFSSNEVGCDVFVFGDYRGCLILRRRDNASAPIKIFARAERTMPADRCESLT